MPIPSYYIYLTHYTLTRPHADVKVIKNRVGEFELDQKCLPSVRVEEITNLQIALYKSISSFTGDLVTLKFVIEEYLAHIWNGRLFGYAVLAFLPCKEFINNL